VVALKGAHKNLGKRLANKTGGHLCVRTGPRKSTFGIEGFRAGGEKRNRLERSGAAGKIRKHPGPPEEARKKPARDTGGKKSHPAKVPLP